jgi:glycosyltransferase involved in cell wall biosynthesis
VACILILGVKVPFTKGGQEVLVATLARELKARNHEVDLVELPFSVLPKEGLLNQAAMWRSLDLEGSGARRPDLVIATKFPSYYARHSRKSLWLVHQHRAIYDLYGSRYSDFSDDPRDEQLRRMLQAGDDQVIRECAYVSGISQNVVNRLASYNGIQGEVLYPPLPLGNRYHCKPAENYILSVGRLCSIKRVDLAIKAMPIVHHQVKLKVVGTPDEPGIMEYFKNEIDKHHLWDRIEFLGRVSDEELLDLYARASAVYYAPHNEDYGYVTLEAMASAKAVITASDSGGVLEFVADGKTGLIVAPDSDSIGHAFNRLIEDTELALNLGKAGRKFIDESGLGDAGWEKVISGLLSPLIEQSALEPLKATA